MRNPIETKRYRKLNPLLWRAENLHQMKIRSKETASLLENENLKKRNTPSQCKQETTRDISAEKVKKTINQLKESGTKKTVENFSRGIISKEKQEVRSEEVEISLHCNALQERLVKGRQAEQTKDVKKSKKTVKRTMKKPERMILMFSCQANNTLCGWEDCSRHTEEWSVFSCRLSYSHSIL